MANRIEGGAPRLWRAWVTVEGAVLLGAAGVTALAVGAPWFLLLGASGYAILGWSRMKDLRAERENARYRLLPPALEGLGARARKSAEEGHRAAQAVLDEVGGGAEFVKGLFAGSVESVRALHEKHQALVRRQQEIEQYLAKVDRARLEREGDDLRARAARAADAPERDQYLAAAESMVESVSVHEELSRDAKRIEAQLAGIRAALESARAKVVLVKSAEARGAAGEGEAVASALGKLADEVDALGKAVDEVFVRAGTRTGTRKRTGEKA